MLKRTFYIEKTRDYRSCWWTWSVIKERVEARPGATDLLSALTRIAADRAL